MTIKEVKEHYKGQYVDCEIYRFNGSVHNIHNDFIYTPDEYNENEKVVYESLMDEEDYDMTIMQIVVLPQILMSGMATKMLKCWLLF